jgi:ABC-2 type transport system permease protein
VLADHRTGTEHLSQLIADQLNASDNVTVLYINEKDINASLNNKSVDGVIYFPPNFTRNVLASEPSYVKIITEGNNPAAAGMVAQKYANASSMALAPYLSQAARPSVPGMPQASMVSVQTEELFGEGYKTIDFFAPYILGVIAFLFVFMFTGVTFLRERSFGTLERLIVSPITRMEIILGYMLGFSIFALIQSLIILMFAIFVLNVKIAGNVYDVVVVQILVTLAAVNLGIFVSSFAKNELQAVQFIPLLLLPQIFLDGMFWPVSTLPDYLQALSYIMPLTYVNDALQGIMVRGYGLGAVWFDLAVLLAFAILMVVLSALTLNKQL